jgi:hypothetical protein
MSALDLVNVHIEAANVAIRRARLDYEGLTEQLAGELSPTETGRLQAHQQMAMDRWAKSLGARDALEAFKADLTREPAA